MSDDAFTHHAAHFEPGIVHAGVELSEAEAKYAELFSEVIWDGLITTSNQLRLENARKVFGLSPQRTQQLEAALTAAHEMRTDSSVLIEAEEAPSSRGTLAPTAAAGDPGMQALQLRIRTLEKDKRELRSSNRRLSGHVNELEELVEQLQSALQSTLQELADAHEELSASSQELVSSRREIEAAKSVRTPASQPPPLDSLRGADIPFPAHSLTQKRHDDEIDWSTPGHTGPSDDPSDLHRQLDDDPRDTHTLKRMFDALRRRQDIDRRWCVAQVLVYLGEANDEQRELYERHAHAGLVTPRRAVNEDEWRELLFHSTQDHLIGDVLAEVAEAVLLGQLTRLKPGCRQQPDEALLVDPHESSVQAVRSFGWAAEFLGQKVPPLYADPAFEGITEMVLTPNPATRLGRGSLVGRTNKELAFLAGQHLCWYRKEHLLGRAVGSLQQLEDVLLAALAIGNPALPMTEAKKDRVEPLVEALQPLLDEATILRLQQLYDDFAEAGCIVDVARWHRAVERTALFSGLLLANDLDVAEAVLTLQQHNATDVEMEELIVFFTAARCSELRRRVGIALAPQTAL